MCSSHPSTPCPYLPPLTLHRFISLPCTALPCTTLPCPTETALLLLLPAALSPALRRRQPEAQGVSGRRGDSGPLLRALSPPLLPLRRARLQPAHRPISGAATAQHSSQQTGVLRRGGHGGLCRTAGYCGPGIWLLAGAGGERTGTGTGGSTGARTGCRGPAAGCERPAPAQCLSLHAQPSSSSSSSWQ